MNEAIHDAFLRTTYRAFAPGGVIALRVGRRDARLDALLGARGARGWAFVTGWNPGATRLPAEQNDARHEALGRALVERGLEFFEGEGVGDAGDWPAERSLLVIGISEDEAVRVARSFGQLAIVVGALGEPARLALCENEP